MNASQLQAEPDPVAELRQGDRFGLVEGIVQFCRTQYQVAVAIGASEPWERQVRRAARAVNADAVPYRMLVDRARQIVLRGPLYAERRNGKIRTLGASLNEDGGYQELRSRPDPFAAPKRAATNF